MGDKLSDKEDNHSHKPGPKYQDNNNGQRAIDDDEKVYLAVGLPTFNELRSYEH
jgi:hypothetical protein